MAQIHNLSWFGRNGLGDHSFHSNMNLYLVKTLPVSVCALLFSLLSHVTIQFKVTV